MSYRFLLAPSLSKTIIRLKGRAGVMTPKGAVVALACCLPLLTLAGAQLAPAAEAGGVCQALVPASSIAANSSDNGITNPATMPLVAAVDFARVYNDSKTVVDRPLKAPPPEVAAAYDNLSLPDPLTHPEEMRNYREELADFLAEWTDQEGTDMESLAAVITPPPSNWLVNVTDPDIRQWAFRLHDIWGALGRQLSPRVRERPELYTMLWVPNSFVVPGARFREVYYWDSYWVIKGLLVSELNSIAEHIVDNMIFLIENYGHIPNGIRTYYINRSQPPLFSEMVRLVHEADPNADRLARALPALLAEHEYWTSSQPPVAKQVRVQAPGTQQLFNLSRYYANWYDPRPESFREDFETSLKVDPQARKQLFHDLASGAESGWDFSSRWFANGMNLTTVMTTQVIPADLNAFLYQVENNIASFAEELGCDDVAARFRQLADTRRTAIQTLMWDNSTSQWRDLILLGPGPGFRLSNSTAASNWVPLFAGVADPGSQQALDAVRALQNSGLIHEGGLAATTVITGQQWDFPNVWPPLVDMAVVGAETYGGAPGADLAARLAQSYLNNAYQAWKSTGNMFEKFNALRVGVPGGGGEYNVVDGFGWTNGVALSFLDKYGWNA